LSTIQRELKDPVVARKLARAIEALGRGQSLDRAAAYASLDRRVLVRVLGSLKGWADSLGLAPASVGITTVDPKMKPPFPMMTVLALGALAIGAVMLSRRV